MAGPCVLQVIPTLDAGGAERTTVEIAEALRDAGGRALVATEGGRLEDEVIAAGGTILRLAVASKNILTLRRNAARLAQIIAAEGVDLIHARSRAPAWSALWAARRTQIPFVTTYHGAYSEGFPGKRLYNSVMARGDRVIANSDYIRDHVLKTHRIDAARLTTIPRGVDPAVFDPAAVTPARLAEARLALGLPRKASEPVVILPGRLTGWKGHRVLIAALKRVRDAGLSFQGRLVGDAQGRDAYVAELQAAIAKAGLSDCVRLIGHMRDAPALYAAADLIAAPSVEPEAFGRVAVEAQAMQRPVIVSDHGGQRETVIDGATGWRAPPGDEAALADRLIEALSLPEAARARMGERARARVVERFSLAALKSATLGVYAELLGAGPPATAPRDAHASHG